LSTIFVSSIKNLNRGQFMKKEDSPLKNQADGQSKHTPIFNSVT